MILKIVTIRLITAASRTPRATSAWKNQTPSVETAAASSVSPSPKAGTNAPRVAVMKTQ